MKTRLTCIPGSTREGNIVDGLASRGVHHWCGLFRSLRVAPADFRPGTRPAHPGPAHRRMSAVAFQVVGELGGGVLAAAAWGWRIVFPLLVGHLRAAMSIASQTRTGAACCRPNRVPDCFPGAAAGDGRQVHEPLPGSDTGDIAHPLHPGWLAVKSRLTRSGREPRSAAGTVVRTFRRGCAATRPCSRMTGAHRVAVHHHAPAPQGRGDAPVPVGSVRGTELSLDEKGQSASSGSSRRLPARRLVVAGPPGTPAHWHISTGRAAVLLAVNGLLPRESLLHPFREVRRCFFQAARPTTPGAADSRARSPPGLSRLTAETLLTPGRRNDPCGTCPPSPPPLWAGRPLTSSHRRDRPAPSPTISRTTRNPEPIRAPHSRHSPILSRHQNTGSPLSKKHQAPQSWPSPTSRHGACPPPASRRRPSTTVPETLTAVLGITFTYAP